jgi:signal peptidase I
VAAPEKVPTSSVSSDLHAQIQARIAARRSSAQANRLAQSGQVSVADLKAAHSQTPSTVRADAGHVARRRRHAPPPAPAKHLHRVLRLVVLLLVTGVSVIGLRTFVIASYYIPSASMERTLHGCPGCQPDMVLVDKLRYRFRSISRTEVVVFNRPPLAPPEDKQLIKRVIGLPGDTVSGHGGHVYIGDKQLVEPYVNPACKGTADFAAVTVPPGEYFMMGDNRCDSFDSRMFGTIPRSAVIGRAFAVIWPAKHIRWL